MRSRNHRSSANFTGFAWGDEEGGGFEGRYRINDVRHRSKIRSVVLKNITKASQREEIALASPRVRVETV